MKRKKNDTKRRIEKTADKKIIRRDDTWGSSKERKKQKFMIWKLWKRGEF